MTNKEMFTAIIERMDSMESGLSGRMDNLETGMTELTGRMDSLETGITELSGRMDSLETRIDKLDSDIDMEFKAVRMEMSVVNNSLKKDISILDDKIDRLMFIKDVDGYEKMKTQVEVLTNSYQELSEKIG